MKLCTHGGGWESGGMGFQRQTAQNLEHRNFLISILVKDLPNIKKQIKVNDGWQPLDIIQVATQFFQELKKKLSLPYKSSLCKNRKAHWSFLPIPKPPLFISKGCTCKNSEFRNQKSFLEELHSFPMPLRYKCSTEFSLGTKCYLFEMQTSGR